MNYNKADFIASYGISSQLPESDRPELSFSGRSNVGKSSLINKLCSRKNLARVSSTPGKTATINFYSVDDCYFVDLPGYGYAKVPQDLQAHWQAFIDRYFRTREALRGLVVVMDIRHPLKDYDLQMLGYAAERGLPAHGLLTKADKLGRGQQMQTLQKVKKEVSSRFGDSVTVQTYSGESRQGVDELRGIVGGWLGLDVEPPADA